MLSNTLMLQKHKVGKVLEKCGAPQLQQQVEAEKKKVLFSSQFPLRLNSSVFFYPWFPHLYKQPSLIIVLMQHVSAFPKQERKLMSKKLSVHHKRCPKPEGSQSIPYKGTTWGEKKKPTRHKLYTT